MELISFLAAIFCDRAQVSERRSAGGIKLTYLYPVKARASEGGFFLIYDFNNTSQGVLALFRVKLCLPHSHKQQAAYEESAGQYKFLFITAHDTRWDEMDCVWVHKSPLPFVPFVDTFFLSLSSLFRHLSEVIKKTLRGGNLFKFSTTAGGLWQVNDLKIKV